VVVRRKNHHGVPLERSSGTRRTPRRTDAASVVHHGGYTPE
jgi:hypothetical protein